MNDLSLRDGYLEGAYQGNCDKAVGTLGDVVPDGLQGGTDLRQGPDHVWCTAVN